MSTGNSLLHDGVSIYATFLRVGFVLRWLPRVPRRLPTDSYFEISSDGLRCKSWVPVLSLRQGTARTSKAYQTSYKPYLGRCILNHVLIIRRRDFGVIKQKMRQNIAILLYFNVCLMYFQFLDVFFGYWLSKCTSHLGAYAANHGLSRITRIARIFRGVSSEINLVFEGFFRRIE